MGNNYDGTFANDSITQQISKVKLIHKTCNEECPSLCSDEWSFFSKYNYPDTQGFQQFGYISDKSIKVSCGMNLKALF